MYSQKTQSGSYRYFERFKNEMTGKLEIVSITSQEKLTQVEAAARLQAAWDKKRRPLPSVDARISDLIQAYLNDRKQVLRETSYKREESITRAMEKYIGADVLCSKLSAGIIRNALNKSKKTNAWKNGKLHRWGVVFKWAYRNDYLDDIGWLEKLEPWPDESHKDKIRDKYLEREELAALLDGMEIEQWRDITLFLALSGLRFGELAALTKRDIDLPARVIHVNKSYSYNTRQITPPKSADSVREVAMSDELYELAVKMKKARYGRNTRSVLFVCTESGGYIVNGSYDKYLKQTAKKILGRDHVTAHVLRHTYTSLMAEAGVPLEVIARQLGHSNSAITRDVYYHVTRRQKEMDADLVRAVKIL